MRAFDKQFVQGGSIILIGNDYVGDNIIMSSFVRWAKDMFYVQWVLPERFHDLFDEDSSVEIVKELNPGKFRTDDFVVASYNKDFKVKPKTYLDQITSRGYLLNCGEDIPVRQFQYDWDSDEYKKRVPEENQFMPNLFMSAFSFGFTPKLPALSKFFDGVKTGKQCGTFDEKYRIGVFTDSKDENRKLPVAIFDYLKKPRNVEYVHILGSGEVSCAPKGCYEVNPLALFALCSWVSTCDALITSNSAAFHIAVAMRIPVFVYMVPGFEFPTWTNYHCLERSEEWLEPIYRFSDVSKIWEILEEELYEAIG